MRQILEPFNLQEASMDYLVEYLFFFKKHLVQHRRFTALMHGKSRRAEDTLASFRSILATAVRRAGNQQINIICQACRDNNQSNERVAINSYSGQAINRALANLERLGVFDRGRSIPMDKLCTPGHLSVIDVTGNSSPRGQEILLRHILRTLYEYVDRREYEGQGNGYNGVIIFLDEAWRFFASDSVAQVVESISRMGRALRIGLWIADQVVPSGPAETTIMNNIKTRIIGIMSVEPSQLKRLMPLDDRQIDMLQNLSRGTGMFFNTEYSRMPVPVIIPACRCYHEREIQEW